MGSDVTSLHTVVIIILFVKIYISKVHSITFSFFFFFFRFKILPMFQWTMYTAPPGRSKLGLCSSGWLLDPLALVLKSITCEFSDRVKLTDQIYWGGATFKRARRPVYSCSKVVLLENSQLESCLWNNAEVLLSMCGATCVFVESFNFWVLWVVFSSKPSATRWATKHTTQNFSSW